MVREAIPFSFNEAKDTALFMIEHRILNPLAFAFTRDVARTVGMRAHWKCQECNSSFRTDNLLMDAAHIDHDKSNPYYNHPDNGRLLDRNCHLTETIQIWQASGREDDKRMVLLLLNRNWGYTDEQGRIQQGLHHRDFYARYPETLEEDRKEIMWILTTHCIDTQEFIPTDKSVTHYMNNHYTPY